MHEQTETVVYRDIIVLLTLVSLSLSLSTDTQLHKHSFLIYYLVFAST